MCDYCDCRRIFLEIADLDAEHERIERLADEAGVFNRNRDVAV